MTFSNSFTALISNSSPKVLEKQAELLAPLGLTEVLPREDFQKASHDAVFIIPHDQYFDMDFSSFQKAAQGKISQAISYSPETQELKNSGFIYSPKNQLNTFFKQDSKEPSPVIMPGKQQALGNVSLKKDQRRPALFLDRDGIIVEDTGYLSEVEKIKILPGIRDILNWAKKQSYLIFMVTNQAGIAKGYFEESDLHRVNQSILEQLQLGDIFTKMYYSPYHPEATKKAYKKASLLRKPQPGMLLQAAYDHRIDFNKSFMLGDKDSDVINLPGLTNILLQGKYPLTNTSVPRFHSLSDVLTYLES